MMEIDYFEPTFIQYKKMMRGMPARVSVFTGHFTEPAVKALLLSHSLVVQEMFDIDKKGNIIFDREIYKPPKYYDRTTPV